MTATYQTSTKQEPEVSEERRLTMPAPEPAPAEETERVAAVAGKREMVRVVNEQIRLLAQQSGDTFADKAQVDFVCECPQETCFAVVPMTVTEWKAATSEVDYYVAHPQHVAAGDQAVVTTDRYAVARAARPGEWAHCQANSNRP
jgi:hypothetical protein